MLYLMEHYEHLLDNVKRIHFVGIGGSGMCPLAEILHNEGYEITGSDVAESDTLERIRSYGIPVTMGHFAENVQGGLKTAQNSKALCKLRSANFYIVEKSDDSLVLLSSL